MQDRCLRQSSLAKNSSTNQLLKHHLENDASLGTYGILCAELDVGIECLRVSRDSTKRVSHLLWLPETKGHFPLSERHVVERVSPNDIKHDKDRSANFFAIFTLSEGAFF